MSLTLASVLNGLTASMLVVAILAYGKIRELRTVTIASSLGYTVAEGDEVARVDSVVGKRAQRRGHCWP
jgi:hypothetical protein